MTGWWLASYAALWLVVLVLCLLLVGNLRELGALRRSALSVPSNPFESGPLLGAQIPSLTLRSVDGGEPVRLDGGAGMPTLLIFLTPMCQGCQSAAEILERFLSSASSDRVAVRIVLCGPRETCQSFLSVYRLPAFVSIDEDYKLPESLGVHMYPIALLYGIQGTLLRTGLISREQGLTEVMNGVIGYQPGAAR